MRRISFGDWALILATLGSFMAACATGFAGYVELNDKVNVLSTTQVTGRAERIQHEDRLFEKLTEIDEKLNRIEGKLDR